MFSNLLKALVCLPCPGHIWKIFNLDFNFFLTLLVPHHGSITTTTPPRRRHRNWRSNALGLELFLLLEGPIEQCEWSRSHYKG